MNSLVMVFFKDCDRDEVTIESATAKEKLIDIFIAKKLAGTPYTVYGTCDDVYCFDVDDISYVCIMDTEPTLEMGLPQ